MNKYLFLDIDGVLNSVQYMNATKDAILKAETKDDQALSWLDPEAIALVNRIVAETRCTVVLSSSWRVVHDLDAVTNYLAKKGATFTLSGETPYGTATEEGKTCWDRGAEIRSWLEVHAEHPCVFAILDDDRFDIVDYFPAQFVNTHGDTGITFADVEKTVRILNSGQGQPLAG